MKEEVCISQQLETLFFLCDINLKRNCETKEAEKVKKCEKLWLKFSA